MRTLRALHQSGGRLHGRLDRDVPFVLTGPGNPNPDGSVEVPVSIAEELHNAGLIEIDEAAPIEDIYVFQVSFLGRGYLALN